MGKGLAGTSLGLGIGALVLGWLPIIGWLIVIAALIVSIIAIVKCKTPEDGKGMAIAGLIISIVAFVFLLLFVFYIAALFTKAASLASIE